MLNEILDLVKDQAMKAVTNANIPADKKEAAVETTTSTLVDELKNHLSADNLSSLSGFLKGGSDATANPLASTLQNSVISSLSQKVEQRDSRLNCFDCCSCFVGTSFQKIGRFEFRIPSSILYGEWRRKQYWQHRKYCGQTVRMSRYKN